MKKRLLLVTSLLLLSLIIPSFAQRGRRRWTSRATVTTNDNNGCDLRFAGSSRKAVKLRPVNLNYPFHNGGRAISVSDWFSFVCTLDQDVPANKSDIPESRPMDLEKVKVKLRAFVLAFKRDPDNDLHVQVGDSAHPYKQTQLIVEIPPGAAYCDARSNLMDLSRTMRGHSRSGNFIFDDPPFVEITGYLFLDAFHIHRGRSDYCTDNGGRGIKNGLRVSPVRGLWEIHPVIKLERVTP